MLQSKKLKFLMGGLGLLLFSKPLMATTVIVKNLNDLVASCGLNSVWVDGEISSITDGKNAVGWPVMTLEIKGKVLKAPPAGYQHVLFGNWVKASPEVQTFKVQMFGSQNRELIKGLGIVPPVGTHAVMGISGESKKSGLSGFCGTMSQGLFKDEVVNGKNVVNNGFNNKNLDLKQLTLSTKNQSTEKSLSNLQSSAPGPLPKAEFVEVLQGIIDQNFAKPTGVAP